MTELMIDLPHDLITKIDRWNELLKSMGLDPRASAEWIELNRDIGNTLTILVSSGLRSDQPIAVKTLDEAGMTSGRLAAWCHTYPCHLAIGHAIHAISTQDRSAAQIWRGPSAREMFEVRRLAASYLGDGIYLRKVNDHYDWGDQKVYIPERAARTRGDLAAWSEEYSCHIAIAHAINWISTPERTAECIWSDPSGEEVDSVLGLASSYLSNGTYPRTKNNAYQWGLGFFEILHGSYER